MVRAGGQPNIGKREVNGIVPVKDPTNHQGGDREEKRGVLQMEVRKIGGKKRERGEAWSRKVSKEWMV